jgi:membrane associated rhomboid family serine protease
MGIYDRDYYRSEGRSFLGSFTERGKVCRWLIGANVVCFVIQLISTNQRSGSSPFTDNLMLDVQAVLHGEVWRLVTYAFLHAVASPMHILFNMLFLYWFGRDVEEAYGPREFLAFYLGAAVLGGAAFVATKWSTVGYCLGASGAVTAVLVLAACREPGRIILLFFFVPCPIWLLVVFLVAKDALDFLGGGNTGTAVQVHLAGAAFGFLYYRLQWRLTGWWPGFRLHWRRAARPKLRIYDEPRDDRLPAPVGALTSSLPAAMSSLDDEQLEAKMDAILEKISRVGKENITAGEREVLLRAGERIRRRRS